MLRPWLTPRSTKRSMRSTNPVIPLTLPYQDRRTLLQSFWLAVSMLFGCLCWFFGWCLQMPFPWMAGLAGGIALALLVWAKQEFVRRCYGAWNRRLVRPFAELASRAVLAICFFIVFVGTGRLGARLQRGAETATTWEHRVSSDGKTFDRSFAGMAQPGASAGWIRSYVQWAIRSGNVWSITLIPFLLLLRLFRNEEQKGAEGNIYTLF